MLGPNPVERPNKVRWEGATRPRWRKRRDSWRHATSSSATAGNHSLAPPAYSLLLASCMAQPRRVLPGMTVLITRRTLRRTHLLRPDRALNEFFVYCLAIIARRHGVLVHAAVLMSTHEHLVLTDVHGQLPRFLHELHRMLALGVKVLRKWEGTVWDAEKTSVVELRTPQAVIEKLAYVMANPVAAGLVRSASEWPGITTVPGELGCGRRTAARPSFYFDRSNPCWPASTTLELTMPPGLGIPDAAARNAVATELAELESAAHATVRTRGWRFLGKARLRSLSPYDRATSPEPLRARNPVFAVGRGQRAAFFEAVAVLRLFRHAYREARERWRTGLREAMFPSGTWLMRWLHSVAVVSA
jgi:putative transposase